MRVVVVLASRPSPVEAQIVFHQRAGADLVIVPRGTLGDDRDGWLDARVRDRSVVELPDVSDDRDWYRRAGSTAVSDYGADWVIPVGVGEFWWPRARSLKEVLEPIPPRYGIVQALLRPLLPDPADASGPVWRRSIRPTLLPGRVDRRTPWEGLLRKMFRTHPALDLAADDGGPGTGQPLRGWYPIEVFQAGMSAPAPSSGEVARGLEAGTLVVDPRLEEALTTLTAEGGGTLELADADVPFRVPNVVEDAAYAVECAAVGELDISALDELIRDLEARITWLESRPRPRARRALGRLARRHS